MEVCLPADFYKLRDELPVDWAAPDHPWSPRHLDSCPAAAFDHPWSPRHLDSCPARDHVNQCARGPARDTDLAHADSINACADPAWRVF
jgi:hypothetical protein